MRVIRLLTCAALCAGATRASAQCPNGTPPPCASTRLASVAKRLDPPLDERTWIVVPFNNVTRATDVDWMRDASVNLLYLDLSRWRDIRVVDDARVADFMRQVPEARVVPLSLVGATALARRAGAGRLVMGSIIKQGPRTTVVAKVFDVRRNTLVRSAEQVLTTQDSLMPVFGRLARAILDIAEPPGFAPGVGTSRIDAYQAYVAGLKALNRFDLDGARPHFERALKLDSTFALAHYKLAVTDGWDVDTPLIRHAAAAERFSGALPARERSLIKALSAFERQQYGTACDIYGSLVKADSSDVEALYGFGECSFHDQDVVASSGGTPAAFRGNKTTAMRAFLRMLDLDPSNHLAYQHVIDILLTQTLTGWDRAACPSESVPRADCTYMARVLRDHDSIVVTPALVNDRAAMTTQAAAYRTTNSRRHNLTQALTIAQGWVNAAPDEDRAHNALGDIHMKLGSASQAESAFAKVGGRLADLQASTYLLGRSEALLKLGRTPQLRSLLDSTFSLRSDSLAIPRVQPAPLAKLLAVLVGRFAPFESVRPIAHDAVSAYRGFSHRALATGGDESIAAAERAYLDAMQTTTSWTDSSSATRESGFAFTLRMPRLWPPTAYPRTGRRGTMVAAVARGDSARLRTEALAWDSVLAARPRTVGDSGASIILADAFLIMGDSARALRVARRALDTVWANVPFGDNPATGTLTTMLAWPRMALLRAELEAAGGNRAAAREWYRRFLDLWSGADHQFVSIIARARAGYDASAVR